MPSPVSIICAEGGAEDKTTGLVSVFNVIEQIAFKRAEPDQPSVPFKMRVIATWLREEADSFEQQFENEISLLQPVSKLEVRLGGNDFSFVKGKSFYRTIALFDSILPIDGDGVMQVQSKIRPKNSESWLVQSYPIVVKEIRDTPNPASNGAG